MKIIDLFKKLGIFVNNTTSNKYKNSCLGANIYMTIKINNTWHNIECSDIKLTKDATDNLISITLYGEEKKHENITLTEKERREFNDLIGGY